MRLDSFALVLVCASAALAAFGGAACSGTTDIHQTSTAKNKQCFDCHSTAYNLVTNPQHAGSFPTTCADCHSTTAWIPAAGGHPEDKFPITTGSHANAGITCGDCHIAANGSDTGGQNCDCIDCHIGAHNAPAVDALHSGVSNYPGSTPTSPPSCLQSGCHPTG
jgi:hypothetical protein